MGSSRPEHWSRFPPTGIEPASLPSPTLADGFFYHERPWEAPTNTRAWEKDYLENGFLMITGYSSLKALLNALTHNTKELYTIRAQLI